MNIVNPTFSFVQFSAGGAPVACDFLLPVALNSDLKFQHIITTSGAGQSNSVAAATQKLYIVKSDAVITDESSLSSNTLYAQTDFFSAIEMEDTKVLLCWGAAMNGIEDMTDGTCFRFCMRVDDGSTVLYFLSNCFQKISDTKYYNTLEYYCAADNYGFYYCDGCTNKARLPLYLGGPQVKEEQTAYVFSDGRRKLTKYQAGKLFEVKVGMAPDDIHNKITTALAHDFVNIESPRYTGGIRKDGDYTIGWDRPEDLEAPASTKAFATPYSVVNDNCAECEDYIPCVAPTVPAFTLPDGVVGTAYNKTISLTGTAPFTLSALVRPSWMNISVSGSTITFSGTPDSAPGAAGAIETGSINFAGHDYTDGTYNDVPLDGGSGTGGKINITFSGGVATAVSIADPGEGYESGDFVGVLDSNVGGTGAGSFSYKINTVASGGAANVSFTVTNACGSDNGSATINVSAPECIAAAISGSPVLPDGTVGTAYSYSITLTGTTPFSLSSIVKPSWMTIAVSGSSINFSGTPDAAGTGETVSFTINNCTDDTVNFSDTIDVASSEVTTTKFGLPTFNPSEEWDGFDPEFDLLEFGNIIGVSGATVNISITTLTNTNGGSLEVNDNPANYEGYPFSVVLDSEGNGSFKVGFHGLQNSSTSLLVIFTIVTVSSGTIGSPDTYQISKSF